MLAEIDETTERIVELACNLDDMTPEQIGFAMDCFFSAGALDVYTITLGMKKSRPGVMLNVICREADKPQMVQLIFQHTTTLGIRENISNRYALKRSIATQETPCGAVRVKTAEGYGVKREKIEYDDIARIAKEKGISFKQATELISK